MTPTPIPPPVGNFSPSPLDLDDTTASDPTSPKNLNQAALVFNDGTATATAIAALQALGTPAATIASIEKALQAVAPALNVVLPGSGAAIATLTTFVNAAAPALAVSGL